MESYSKLLTAYIDDKIADIKDVRSGDDYSPSSNLYGSGYDDGELNGLRLALSMWEILHAESTKDPQPIQDYPLEGQDG